MAISRLRIRLDLGVEGGPLFGRARLLPSRIQRLGRSPVWEGEAPAEPDPKARQEPRPPKPTSGLKYERMMPGNVTSWKAGVARRVITPAEPMWLAGWAVRKEPARGTLTDLYAKALALEDDQGSRL